VCSPADGQIIAIDHTGARAADDFEVLDFGPAATIMPGLIDAHVHLCWDPHADPLDHFLGQPDEALAARAQAALEESLQAGITTVRDLGDRDYLTLEVRARSTATPWPAPEILVAGPPITPPKGHCWFLGGEAAGIDEVVAAVDERAGHGVDVIKVMATGGMLTPGWGLHESQYDTATLAAAVTAAGRHGLPVTTHAHGGPGIRAAVEAGVHGIEHCTFLTADDVDCDWEVVDQIAVAGIHVSATEAWAPSTEPFPPAAVARLERVWDNLERMHRAGVQLSISSDAGIGPRKPHGVLPHGAVLFAGLGMTNHEALTAVTARPATACGLDHRKARLTPGYDADLLIIDGNPVEDVAALLHPLYVVRGGRAAVP
jgi:imidazolonepropionase-like amidohydrolase